DLCPVLPERLRLLRLRQTRLLHVVDKVARVRDVRRADELGVRDVRARSDVEFALVDGGKTIPDVTILRAQRCVAVHRITELSLPADLARHQNGVAEPVELAAVCLEAVLHGEELLTN